MFLGLDFWLGSIAHVAEMSLLTLRLHLVDQFFIKKKCIFLSFLTNFLIVFFVEISFCFAKQISNDF
jgi:hypothetical protein